VLAPLLRCPTPSCPLQLAAWRRWLRRPHHEWALRRNSQLAGMPSCLSINQQVAPNGDWHHTQAPPPESVGSKRIEPPCRPAVSAYQQEELEVIDQVGSVYLGDLDACGNCLAFNVVNGGLARLDSATRDRVLAQRLEEGSAEREMFHVDDSVHAALASTSPKLMLSLEITRSCNLRCPYCYQAEWASAGIVSDRTLTEFVHYVRAATNVAHFSSIEVEYMGGEPMLGLGSILRTNRLLEHAGIAYRAVVSTNGTRDMVSLFDQVRDLFVSITLTLPEDHARMRYFHGKDTSAMAIEQIRKVSASPRQDIWLRYITHRENIDDFATYLSWVRSLDLACVRGIQVERIEPNATSGGSVQTLTLREFNAWKYGVAVSALLDQGWPLPDNLVGLAGPCRAHSPYSCKVLSDGTVTPCAYFFSESPPRCGDQEALTIAQLSSDPSLLGRTHGRAKTNPKDHEDCRTCADSFHCRGKLACFDYACPPREMLESQNALVQLLMTRHADSMATILT
jgi:sulfatase maturation enzyme AslB (radical SAM superfamily)